MVGKFGLARCGLCDEIEEMDGGLRIRRFANWLLVVCEIESVRRGANIRMVDSQSWNFAMVEFRKVEFRRVCELDPQSEL